MLHHPGVVSGATLNPTLSLVSEWLRLLPFLGVLALLGYLAVRPFLPKKKQQKDSLINLKIQKENPKVVNEINIEDLCITKGYCRCWRSKTVRHCAAVGLEIETCIFLSVFWWWVLCWAVAFVWSYMFLNFAEWHKPIYMKKATVETWKKHSRVFLETFREWPHVSRINQANLFYYLEIHCN